MLKAAPAQGQIVPDNSVDSRVTSQGNSVLIEGGTTKGSNLFHSFQNFSVPEGRTVHFKNAANIRNIFSRVTGTSISNINGTIKANDTANLFVLNPNGIIFGANARLDVGGSFMATTADSFQFPNGIEFSALSPQSSPLLTVELPVGLIFGSNAGGINVTDSGHKLVTEISSPISRAGTPPGLQVLPGKNLVLLGGDLSLNGGILFAPGGHIELGSVKQGQVVIDTSTNQWSFNYQPQSTLGRVELTNRSFLDTTGTGGASLGIFGRQVFLKEDSVVLVQTQGVIPDKELRVTASELIDIRSADLPETIPTGLFSVTNNSGTGGQITLRSPSVVLDDGGVIVTRTFSSAKGGNISIEAPSNLNISGSSPINPIAVSIITALSFGSGGAGDIDINASNLSLLNGGRLSSVTFRTGTGGKVSIKADDVKVIGLEPQLQQDGSTIRSGSLGTGDAGSLDIDTSRLTVAKGAKINTSSGTAGKGGELTINAREFIEVNGTSDENLPSEITAEAKLGNPRILKILNLPPDFTGDAGSVNINSPRLTLTNGGKISVLNQGTGNAGDLKISAKYISLDKNSLITATTQGGDGGNITLNSSLTLIRDSSLTATASKKGKGGNISAKSDVFASFGKSSLTAEAEQAQGGNIQINALGIFLSPETQITVTSQLGPQFDGSVEVEAEVTDFSQDPDLSIQVDPPDLYSVCGDSNTTALAYYRIGTAGKPTSPITRSPADGGWLQAAKARYDQRHITYVDPETGEVKPLKRVVGWKTNPNGTITFVNDPRTADQYAPAVAAQLKACHTDQQAKAG
ncbi:two-partner secretion domain-containing protein [Acaryochloris marina NIES-2412]|uniref:two-partner secretion domain-containing protein n=1 Tax=Acaryochloris marina TaxID=155978 RepID=UPI0040587DB2